MNKRRRPKAPFIAVVESGTASQNAFRANYETHIRTMVDNFRLSPIKKGKAKAEIVSWVKCHYYLGLRRKFIPVSIADARKAYQGLRMLESSAGQNDPEIMELITSAKKEMEKKMRKRKPFMLSNKYGLAFVSALTVRIGQFLGPKNFKTFSLHAGSLIALARKEAENGKN